VKVTNEKTENSQVFLTVEMEPAEVEESLEKSYHRLVKKANIPGFRKGKAPREILEQYIGRESLLEDALNNVIPQVYERAIKEQQIEAIARPSIEVTQTDPVVFKATVPLKPTIKLGDYRNIRVTPEPVELTEDSVNAVIETLRHQQATWEPVERPVEFDDLVVFDIESHIEGEPFINQKGVQYQVRRDLSSPVPGFAEQLPGMEKDGDKEFRLPIPSDYPRSELAGKEPWFKVRVTEVKQEILPELNDELAKQISPDFETLAILREKVSAELKQRAEEKAKGDFDEKVVQEVVDLAQVEFPPILVEMEVERLLNEQARRLQMGGHRLEEYLSSINKTEAELREELKPTASQKITSSLVLGKVAEEEKIEVGDSEIDTEIEEMLKNVAENKDELQKSLNTPQSRESVKHLLFTRKTVERLEAIAKGQGAE
jgi:trigger factor